ncbi:MAG: methyltransferase [Clostridiales bacterium]|nr:methyltransferase [Clostridiales bacterium]
METVEHLGRYTLRQRDGLPKLGTDAVRLARFATLRSGWRVLDLGCGVGVLPLLLAERADGLTLDGIECVPEAAALAGENLRANGLAGTIVQGDLREPGWLTEGHYDLVISNPPYFAPGTGYVATGNRGIARTELYCTLPELCQAAGRRLKTGGRLAVCLRPERLADLFEAMRGGASIEPKRLQLVQSAPGRSPRLALAEGVRQGGRGLTVEPVLLLNEETGG